MRARRSQQGVVLFIALIVLVAMTLAGISLMRSVDTGTIIAGNFAFKHSAVAAADAGVEGGRNWLLGQAVTSLYNDNTGAAYYANMQSSLDLLGTNPGQTDYDWNGAATLASPPAGYTVRYVIHRLCDAPGNPASVNCIKSATTGSSTASGTKGAAAYGQFAIAVPTNAYYRITVRVNGPRNTLSYVQAVVY
jgi:type IV pilus assembly protein PilX